MTEFDYEEYFKKIKPKSKIQIYNRFLFAFLSVHTTWESNIRAYEVIKDKYWGTSRKVWLKNRLQKSRIGMYNMRSDFISQFTDKFHQDYKWYLKRRKEKWTDYRNRLMKDIKGLGHAKSSFAIEMIYPNAAWVTCVDTHIAQLFGTKQEKLSMYGYDLVESLCIKSAKELGMKPTEWRWRWWDDKQGHTNPRYWSYVLE